MKNHFATFKGYNFQLGCVLTITFFLLVTIQKIGAENCDTIEILKKNDIFQDLALDLVDLQKR